MELTVLERLLLRNITPQIQGWNFGSMKQARELMESLFSEDEEKALNITIQDGGRVTWRTLDEAGKPIAQVKEVAVSDALKLKIGKFLIDLDKKEMLGFDQYSIYEKFVGEKEKAEVK